MKTRMTLDEALRPMFMECGKCGKNLTAKEWIRDHCVSDSKGSDVVQHFDVTPGQLDKFLVHFELNHRQCNHYSKGVCTDSDAPNPGHSRCVGTHLCTQSPEYRSARR